VTEAVPLAVFDLPLVDQRKTRWLLLGWLLLLGAGLIGFIYSLRNHLGGVGFAFFGIALCLFALYRWILHVTRQPTRVTILPSQLALTDLKTSQEVALPYHLVASCRLGGSKGTLALTIQREDGSEVDLVTRSDYEQFGEMVEAFSKALARYETQNPKKSGPTWPDPFWSSRGATVALVLYGLFLLGLVSLMVSNYDSPDGVQGESFMLFLLGLGFLFYAGNWYQTRAQRR
jgi:hypothetical protein